MDAEKTCSQLSRVQQALSRLESFLRRYSPLANAHTNDFLTHDLWHLLPPGLVEDLLLVSDVRDLHRRFLHLRDSPPAPLPPFEDAAAFPDGIFDKTAPCRWLPDHAASLVAFLTAAAGCSLDALHVLSPLRPESTLTAPNPPAMGVKKWHEVERLSAFIADAAQRLNLRSVVDVGSGKGYLGTHLSATARLRVVEVDAVASNTEGAKERRLRLAKRQREEVIDEAVTSLTERVESAARLDQILERHLHGERVVMSGLHTCGFLAMCALQTFLSSETTRAVVNVGCCYHLLDERDCVDTYAKHRTEPDAPTFPMCEWMRGRTTPRPFVLGRNARMIAAQSVDRLALSEETLHPHMFYRVLLQKLLMEKLGPARDDWIVGKLGKRNGEMNFVAYVRKALVKLKLQKLSETLSDEEIAAFEGKWSAKERTFHLFYALRCCLGPAVEACVLLDRLCFLLEQSGEEKPISEAHLYKLFEAEKSPRCYAIFAVKRTI